MFGRGGPFGSIFGNDSFFSDPFSQMDRMMLSMLNDPFFGNPLGVGIRPPAAHHLQPAQLQRGRQPVIEEVDDAGHAEKADTAQDEPIVEEPDDEPSPQARAAQRQRRHSPPRQQQYQQQVAAPMNPLGQLFGALASGGTAAGGSGSSFVFSSSSYSSMGPGGVTYQASSTTRMGPGGVRETQSVVRDGRSATESVTISRGLGDGRQRTLVRTRDAISGREEQLEDLQGLAEHEADTFDDQWRHQAERNLPGGGGFGAAAAAAAGGRIAGGRSGGTAQQRPLALPAATAGAGGGGGGSHHGGGVLYDTSAGLATAQRASYMRPPSPGAGRIRAPQPGGSAQYAMSGGGAGSSSRGRGGAGGAHYVGSSGSAAFGREPSVLEGQYGQNGAIQQYAQPAAGAGRAPSGSGARFNVGGGQAHSRYGY